MKKKSKYSKRTIEVSGSSHKTIVMGKRDNERVSKKLLIPSQLRDNRKVVLE